MLHRCFSKGLARMSRPDYHQNTVHLGSEDHRIWNKQRWPINNNNIGDFLQLGQEQLHFLGTQQFGRVGRRITSSKHRYLPKFLNTNPPIEDSTGKYHVSQALIVSQVKNFMDFRLAQVSVEQEHLFASLGDG